MFTMGQRLGLGKRCGSRGREARQRGPIITIQRPIRTTTLQSILSQILNRSDLAPSSSGKENHLKNVKPFIETLRVTNPVRQSRASSRKRVLRGGWETAPAKRRQRDQTLCD